MTEAELKDFIYPYYKSKGMMDKLALVDAAVRRVEKLADSSADRYDAEAVVYAAYFHSFINTYENIIREWLKGREMTSQRIEKIITIAWESQKDGIPATLEGRLLHDAFELESGA